MSIVPVSGAWQVQTNPKLPVENSPRFGSTLRSFLGGALGSFLSGACGLLSGPLGAAEQVYDGFELDL